MKKIVCARCGAINLEGFLTYPHCAGCSALLGEATSVGVVWWKRPLRVGWWASVFGGALVALVALALLETRARENGQLLVFVQMPRRVTIGDDFVARFNFDSVQPNGVSPNELRDLTLRLPRNFERQWQILSVDPLPEKPVAQKPDATPAKPLGRIFRYVRWPLERSLRLRLRARQQGEAKIFLWAGCENHLSVQTRQQIFVGPPKKAR